MKFVLRTLVIAAVLGLLLMPATALAQPVVPLLYHGSVTVDDVDAPIGTIITAEIDGEEVATNAPDGTTEVGSYELDIAAHEGDEVVLKVNGVVGGQTTHPNPMSTFEVVLNLSVGEAPPPTLTAEAGGPYSGTEGEAIALSGSASGGTAPYSYAWDLDYDGDYDDATSANPSQSWGTAGTYTIGLQVTDDTGENAIDTATVIVTAVGEFDPYTYDEDDDGDISKEEALNACNAYNAGAGTISKDEALQVVKLYFL
jgi:PKD repeat protein